MHAIFISGKASFFAILVAFVNRKLCTLEWLIVIIYLGKAHKCVCIYNSAYGSLIYSCISGTLATINIFERGFFYLNIRTTWRACWAVRNFLCVEGCRIFVDRNVALRKGRRWIHNFHIVEDSKGSTSLVVRVPIILNMNHEAMANAFIKPPPFDNHLFFLRG